jgi:hypothetical protein
MQEVDFQLENKWISLGYHRNVLINAMNFIFAETRLFLVSNISSIRFAKKGSFKNRVFFWFFCFIRIVFILDISFLPRSGQSVPVSRVLKTLAYPLLLHFDQVRQGRTGGHHLTFFRCRQSPSTTGIYSF